MRGVGEKKREGQIFTPTAIATSGNRESTGKSTGRTVFPPGGHKCIRGFAVMARATLRGTAAPVENLSLLVATVSSCI